MELMTGFEPVTSSLPRRVGPGLHPSSGEQRRMYNLFSSSGCGLYRRLRIRADGFHICACCSFLSAVLSFSCVQMPAQDHPIQTSTDELVVYMDGRCYGKMFVTACQQQARSAINVSKTNPLFLWAFLIVLFNGYLRLFQVPDKHAAFFAIRKCIIGY